MMQKLKYNRCDDYYIPDIRLPEKTDLLVDGGVTEIVKQHDQMAWVSAMNNLRNRAEEIVKDELLYH